MEKPIDLHYELIGKGNPVVLVHGFPFNHTIWMPVAERLKNRAAFILPDLRGFGKSPALGKVYSMDLMAADLAALFDRLDVSKVVLVGHSMGGYVSLAFIRQYPDKVSGLGLVATRSDPDSPERREGRYNSAREIEEQGMGPLQQTMPSKLTNEPALLPELKGLIEATSPGAAAACQRGMAERADFTPSLKDIRVPSIVVAGDADAFVPIESSKKMVNELTDCRLYKVIHGGHMPMLEAPELVAGAIGFLIQQVWG